MKATVWVLYPVILSGRRVEGEGSQNTKTTACGCVLLS
jgi:hypothetical protein